MLEYVNVSSWKNRAVAEEICKLNWGNTGTAFRLYGFHDEWNEKNNEKIKKSILKICFHQMLLKILIFIF